MNPQENENIVPAGSTPIAPIAAEDNVIAPETPATEVAAEKAPESDKPTKSDDAIARFEKMLKDSQSMIGKQSSEIGALRSKLEEYQKQQQPEVKQGPSDEEVMKTILQQMDDGEITINEGMQKALELNSRLTAQQVMTQLQQQRQQETVSQVQEKFLKENPGYLEALESGALQPYLEADPMADEYVAYHKYQADQRIEALKAEYEAKVAAAKEEGAKLAKGAELAGKVIGKQGGSAAPGQQVNRPFKNTQEATAAMMDKLRQIRSASAT